MSYNPQTNPTSPGANQYSNLPERATQESTAEPIWTEQPEKILDESDAQLQSAGQEYNEQQGTWSEQQRKEQAEHRICGLKPWMLWTAIAALVLVLVGAAVGGGVGGSMSHKRHSQASDTNTTTESTGGNSSTPVGIASSAIADTSATQSTPSLTTSEIPEATTTLLRDCPSSNDTLYSYGTTSSPMLFRKFCDVVMYKIPGTENVNTPATSLNGCIDLCASYNVQNQSEIAASSSPLCNAVCWRNGNPTNDWPGVCFGFQTANSSGQFAFGAGNNSNCDSATLINQQLF